MTMTDPDYWLLRYASAIENAVDAPGDSSRSAYLDLARHYWSMHMMVCGPAVAAPAGSSANGGDALVLRRAA